MGVIDSKAFWACNSIAMALFLLRLILRKVKHNAFTTGDYWIMSAAVFMIVRTVIGYYVLEYGNPLAFAEFDNSTLRFSDEQLREIVRGGKLNLLNRVVFITGLWSLKMAVLDLLSQMASAIRRANGMKYTFWTILAITYVASFITIFIECKPVALNWQIYPAPDKCILGSIWLVTYECGNILTDIMLLAVPFPIILQVKISTWKRLQLVFLFSLGFFLIAVAVVRAIQGFSPSQIPLNRTLWGSLEMGMASVVATFPVLYTLLRPKKPRNAGNYYFYVNLTAIRQRVSDATKKTGLHSPHFPRHSSHHSARASSPSRNRYYGMSLLHESSETELVHPHPVHTRPSVDDLASKDTNECEMGIVVRTEIEQERRNANSVAAMREERQTRVNDHPV